MQYLVYVNKVGINSDNNFTYEFYFSEEPQMVWGESWSEKPAYSSNLTVPEQRNYDSIEMLRTEIVFGLAKNSTCFSMQDAKDQVVSLCHEDISEYEEYPEAGRLVFPFGESKTDVEIKLAKRDLAFDGSDKNNYFEF